VKSKLLSFADQDNEKEKLPDSQTATATVHKILFSDLNVTNTIFLTMQRHKNFTDGHYTIISDVLS